MARDYTAFFLLASATLLVPFDAMENPRPSVGESRAPSLVWALVPMSCGLYGYYWWFQSTDELKNYLGDETIDPVRDILIAFVTCGAYLFYMAIRHGRLIQEAQRRAGIADPRDLGVRYLLLLFVFWYGYAKMQKELNRVWQASGGPTATE